MFYGSHDSRCDLPYPRGPGHPTGTDTPHTKWKSQRRGEKGTRRRRSWSTRTLRPHRDCIRTRQSTRHPDLATLEPICTLMARRSSVFSFESGHVGNVLTHCVKPQSSTNISHSSTVYILFRSESFFSERILIRFLPYLTVSSPVPDRCTTGTLVYTDFPIRFPEKKHPTTSTPKLLGLHPIPYFHRPSFLRNGFRSTKSPPRRDRDTLGSPDLFLSSLRSKPILVKQHSLALVRPLRSTVTGSSPCLVRNHPKTQTGIGPTHPRSTRNRVRTPLPRKKHRQQRPCVSRPLKNGGRQKILVNCNNVNSGSQNVSYPTQ